VSRRKRRASRGAATPPPPRPAPQEPAPSPVEPLEPTVEAAPQGPPEPEAAPEPEPAPEPDASPRPAEPRPEIASELAPERPPDPAAPAVPPVASRPASESETRWSWSAREATPPPDPEVVAAADAAATPPAADPFEAAERQAAAEAFSDAREPADLPAVVPRSLPQPVLLDDSDPASAATLAAIAELPGRSSRPGVCPFLRSGRATGALGPPHETVDHRNLCAALAQPLPVSRPQQELVCFQRTHTSCPRYIRGASVIRQRVAPQATTNRSLPVLLATLLLVASIVAVGTYAILRGGLAMPVASPSGSPVTSPTLVASSPSASPSVVPSPTASPAPPTSSPVTPRPSRTPLPFPYRTLDPCPRSQSCFLYTIVAGDSLTTIADEFGTTVEGILAENPDINDANAISVGDEIRVPAPGEATPSPTAR
jgi:LysM domain